VALLAEVGTLAAHGEFSTAARSEKPGLLRSNGRVWQSFQPVGAALQMTDVDPHSELP